jgi:HEAT repeat protein
MALLAIPAHARSQRASLDEARALLDQGRISESCEVFAAHGTESVEYIVSLFRLNAYPDSRAFLGWFLVKIPGPEVDAALIQLLTDPSARIRGLIAEVLGVRCTRGAVPALVGCLSDTHETDLVLVRTDLIPRQIPILVRDRAVWALEGITGQSLRPSGSDEDKAEAWRSWWVKNASTWARDRPE